MCLKIGLLGAMEEEVSAIKDKMMIEEEIIIAGRTYYIGRIDHLDVVLSFSRWGKVASASTATTLINVFNVDFILFTGVAGAVSESLNIGDIVIANGLYQHDMDARPFFDQFQIPLTEGCLFKPNITHIKQAKIAAENMLARIGSLINEDVLASFDIVNPLIHIGIIASGDQFIVNAHLHQNLYFTQGESRTLAVEMEGAAIAQVCEEYKIPYMIIRTISDKATRSAAIDFQRFIKQVASLYSVALVEDFLKFCAL